MNDELVPLRTPRELRRWRSLAQWRGELDEPGEGFPSLSRRGFLQLLGAGAALAGCDRDLPQKVLPYVSQPEGVTPGVPNFYATSMVIDGWATGLVVESHEGRPTKIEGNPEHPASLGATSLFHQASVLQLYDPERARAPRPSGWDALSARLRQARSDGGAGLRLLLPPSGSPLQRELLERVRARHPRMKVTFWSPADGGADVEGARLAFGRPLQPRYDLSAAELIVALDADLLGHMPNSLRHAHDWAARRHPDGGLSRLYTVEPMLGITGSVADHRLRLRPSEIPRVAAALATQLPGLDQALAGAVLPLHAGLSEVERRWARVVGRELRRRGGAGLVAAGPRQSPALHALVQALNLALGSRALLFSAPLLAESDQDLAALARELDSGAVDTLVIAEANPVYAAPADLDFHRVLGRAAERLYLGLYENETAQACTWFHPMRHYLESWGDACASDGTLSLIQPLIQPLHGGRQLEELLSALAGEPHTEPYQLLRRSLERRGIDMEAALKRGFVPGAAETVRPSLAWRAPASDLAMLHPPPPSLELSFALSATVYDGRFANNPWLQETPQPLTKLTWDNAALVSPATAARLGLDDQELLEFTVEGRRARSAVLVAPGHADDCITLMLGYGRGGKEKLASTAGFDVYPLRTTRALHHAHGAEWKKLGRYPLSHTQRHWSMEGRAIALQTTAAEYRRDPQALTAELKGPLPSLLPPIPQEGRQWAMTIDLSLCTGCSACTVACATENNLLVVGKEQVAKRREMDWLRIDTYFAGEPDHPETINQPMMCQHCETAPCEYVCPVNATVHSPDGLNEMVYNRCVGTRFCSNNCPYKVRRFNWFDWVERNEMNRGEVMLQKNPDVTVRERGVMEKCTYCVQRIREAEITAELQQRELATGEVVTACQQACPTRAIRFGMLTDSEMIRARSEPRSYAVLHDQGTRPRTMYLMRVDNPPPDLDT